MKPSASFAAVLISAALILPLTFNADALDVGESAPLFELPNTENEIVKLKDYRGNPCVLVFYRGLF